MLNQIQGDWLNLQIPKPSRNQDQAVSDGGTSSSFLSCPAFKPNYQESQNPYIATILVAVLSKIKCTTAYRSDNFQITVFRSQKQRKTLS